jgi:hypothetical protein
MWPPVQQANHDGDRRMSEEQFAVRPAPDGWPVWATVGHTAGGRVYWLCAILGEPGADKTPFGDPEGLAWEDDLDTPRPAEELVAALDSSWEIVDGCLDRWDEAMMSDVIRPRVRRLPTAAHPVVDPAAAVQSRLLSRRGAHRPWESMVSPRSICGVLVAFRPITDGVSPALESPDCVEVLAAAPRARRALSMTRSFARPI